MLNYQLLEHDLYILKEDIPELQKGCLCLGFKSVPEEEIDQYELFTKYAFQPVKQTDSNTFEVVFILD